MKRNLDFGIDEFLNEFHEGKHIAIWADYDKIELDENTHGLDRSSWEEVYERVLKICRQRGLELHILPLSGSGFAENVKRGLEGKADYFNRPEQREKIGLWVPGCFCCANKPEVNISLIDFYAKKKKEGYKLGAIAPAHHLYRKEARSGQGNLFPGLSYCLSNSTPEFREKFPLAARNLEKICKKDSCEVSFSLPKDATFFRIALSEIRDDEERIY